jgi:uncharacterized cupin superfamily protein
MYLYDVPGGSKGGHCHMEQQEFLIALSGSFDVVLKMESLKVMTLTNLILDC